MSEPILSEATIDEILDEIDRRHNHWLFWALRENPPRRDGEPSDVTFRYEGRAIQLRGLASEAYDRVTSWASKVRDEQLEASDDGQEIE